MLIKQHIIAFLFGVLVFSSAHAQLEAENFARLPSAQGLSLSPDGTRVAFIAHQGDRRVLAVVDIATGQQRLADASDLRAFQTFWVNNDTVLARVGSVQNAPRVRGDIDFTTLLTIDADSLDARPLIRNRRDSGINFDRSRIAGTERRTGRLLMPLRDREGDLNLYAVNPEQGSRRSLRSRGTRNTRYWVSSPDGETHVRVIYSDRDAVLRFEAQVDGNWRTIYRDETDIIDIGVVGFTQNGESLVVSTFLDEAPFTRALKTMSLEDGSIGDTLFSDPQYDYDQRIIDPHQGHVVGVSIERERRESIWFDEALDARQRSLNASFEGATVQLIDWTPDRSRVLASVETDAQAPIYYFVDFNGGGAAPLRLAYPELYNIALPARTPTSYTARDGVSIPAYVATPQGEGPHTFVVLVHGGPEARDFGGFDYLAHFLASRGYGVIQPQFRGSDGFGSGWAVAGRGEWGRGVMQTDVVDAASYLREAGLADNICVAGASYGGYSALAAAAFTPDVFDCAISINGVFDLDVQQAYVRDRFGADSQSARYWNLSIGGEDTERLSSDFLRSISPNQYAENVTTPVLLLHGEDDTVVPVRQSQIMNRSLERAGKPVIYHQLNGGDHWLLEYQTRLEVLRQVEAFLAEHAGD